MMALETSEQSVLNEILFVILGSLGIVCSIVIGLFIIGIDKKRLQLEAMRYKLALSKERPRLINWKDLSRGILFMVASCNYIIIGFSYGLESGLLYAAPPIILYVIAWTFTEYFEGLSYRKQ